MLHGIEFWTTTAVFFGFFTLDILSSCFIIALNKLQITATTTMTFLLQYAAGLGVFQYTHNLSYLTFAALGATAGNFVLVSREAWRISNKQTPLGYFSFLKHRGISRLKKTLSQIKQIFTTKKA